MISGGSKVIAGDVVKHLGSVQRASSHIVRCTSKGHALSLHTQIKESCVIIPVDLNLELLDTDQEKWADKGNVHH